MTLAGVASGFGAAVAFRSATMFGLGLRYKLERAETALRAALAERDDYLRQLAVALGERDELRRQRDHFRGELDRLQRPPDDQEALSRLDAGGNGVDATTIGRLEAT
jgi:hypothetical protein